MPGEPPSAEGPRAFPIFLSLICYRKEGRSPTWVRRSRMLRRTSHGSTPCWACPPAYFPLPFRYTAVDRPFSDFPVHCAFQTSIRKFHPSVGIPFPCAPLHRTGKAIVSNSVQKATCRYPLLRITACGIMISTGINPHGSFRRHAPVHRSQRRWLRRSKQWFRPLRSPGSTTQSSR